MAVTAAPSSDVDSRAKASELIKALNHGMRRSALRFVLAKGPVSSSEIRNVIPGVIGNNLNHHLTMLVTSGAMSREKRVGYRENFYSPTEAIRVPWILAALRLTAAED